MAWGRLDDQANGNAKLLALSDSAWRMWGCGLIYCQANLTDGFIPTHAVHVFGVRGNKKQAIDNLCRSLVPGRAPLWDVVDGGFSVHHYLAWNDSRETVEKERAKAKARFDVWKGKHRSNAVATVDETNSQPVSTTTTTVLSTDQESTRAPARLAFGGKVLEVPKFLDTEFVKRLNGQDFDLTGFYTGLDAQLTRSGEPWDLRWIRDRFAADAPSPDRRRVELDEAARPISARERSDAERVRRNSWAGRCGHESKCETAGACIARVVRDHRTKAMA